MPDKNSSRPSLFSSKRRVYTMLIVLCGLWFIGQGSYIHVKALLAQVLLESAWAETLHGAKEVKPWPWADTWPVNRLTVPALGVSRIVLAGASGQALAFGPGRLYYSDHAGVPDNIIIAGHRDTHFSFVRNIKYGDILSVQTGNNRNFNFTVTSITIVNKAYLDLPVQKAKPMLRLITCYPFNAVIPNGPMRYLIQARLTGETSVQDAAGLRNI